MHMESGRQGLLYIFAACWPGVLLATVLRLPCFALRLLAPDFVKKTHFFEGGRENSDEKNVLYF